MKNTLHYSILFLLCGCGTASAVHSQWSSAMMKEEMAWNKLEIVTKSECLAPPVPREKSLKQAECVEKYTREIVMPVAVAPDLLGSYLVDAREIAVKYKKGSLDRDEANLELTRKSQLYRDAVAARGDTAVAKAQAQDAERAQSFNEAFAASLQQNSAAAPAANRMKTTNCHFVGNMMNCTEF